MIMKSSLIKKTLWLLAVAAVAGTMALSCNKPQPEDPKDPENPENPSDPNAPGDITVSVPDTI